MWKFHLHLRHFMIHRALVRGLQGSSLCDHRAAPPLWPDSINTTVLDQISFPWIYYFIWYVISKKTCTEKNARLSLMHLKVHLNYFIWKDFPRKIKLIGKWLFNYMKRWEVSFFFLLTILTSKPWIMEIRVTTVFLIIWFWPCIRGYISKDYVEIGSNL